MRRLTDSTLGFVRFYKSGDPASAVRPLHFVQFIPKRSFVTYTACGKEVHLPGHETANVFVSGQPSTPNETCSSCRRTAAFRLLAPTRLRTR